MAVPSTTLVEKNARFLVSRGFSSVQVQAVKHMHKALYRENLTLELATEKIKSLALADPSTFEVIHLMTEFLAQVSPNRGIIR